MNGIKCLVYKDRFKYCRPFLNTELLSANYKGHIYHIEGIAH